MDINRLKEFIVLADCLNYSKAANKLYLTQPVLSRHIHDLESSLNAQLFSRDTHRVELTEIGKIAAKEMSAVIETYDTALKNIQHANDTANSMLRVGFLGQAVKPFITQFSQSFSKNHPNIQIEYLASHLDDLISGVNDNSLDLAFVTHIDEKYFKGMDIRHITDDNLCVVVPNGHPYADKESLSIYDLSNEPLIVFHKHSNQHTAVFQEALFEKFHSEMNVVREVSNLDSGLFYASLGIGFFIIPQHLSNLAPNMHILPLSDREAIVSLHLIWRKHNKKLALQSFVQDFSAFFDLRHRENDK